ncbi:endothelin-3 isoform X3 [Dendrobates tinctorius]|uniref:endothelin-3 isoform X3 n=1 Tax=Dendrobates tinctorius TaxID=92724 RepID=UPI003CC9911D
MEQRLLIILGLLVTSNTGFVLALLPQLSGAKGSLQVKEGGRKASRGEKESSTIFLQTGVTLPPGSASPGPQGTPIPGYEQMSPSFHLEPDSGGAHRRERRCTCYTYKDKECVYYCHLDIIWINTPDLLLLSTHSHSKPYFHLALSRPTQLYGCMFVVACN